MPVGLREQKERDGEEPRSQGELCGNQRGLKASGKTRKLTFCEILYSDSSQTLIVLYLCSQKILIVFFSTSFCLILLLFTYHNDTFIRLEVSGRELYLFIFVFPSEKTCSLVICT